FKHIYKLKEEINKEFNKGIVLYMGDTFLQIDENMYAVPVGFLK
ncbi:ATPase, partial [Arcobacter ellisii]